jgi:hypothetical protein
MAGEEALVTGQMPSSARRLTGFEFHNFVDEEKWWTMGKKVLGAHHAR